MAQNVRAGTAGRHGPRRGSTNDRQRELQNQLSKGRSPLSSASKTKSVLTKSDHHCHRPDQTDWAKAAAELHFEIQILTANAFYGSLLIITGKNSGILDPEITKIEPGCLCQGLSTQIGSSSVGYKGPLHPALLKEAKGLEHVGPFQNKLFLLPRSTVKTSSSVAREEGQGCCWALGLFAGHRDIQQNRTVDGTDHGLQCAPCPGPAGCKGK